MFNISCSGRKDWHIHIRDWLDLQKSHAKIHSNFEFDYEDIDYAFGVVEGYSPLKGGRITPEGGFNITKLDIYWLYDHNIGIKMPLSSKTFSDDMYKESLDVLKRYHRKGNGIIVSTDKLAECIKNDFPDYKIEASCIQDITDNKHYEKKVALGLYDTIVLPIHSNDDMKFIESIKRKDLLRLFMNVECSYNCPSKVCYNTTSIYNKDSASGTATKMQCSFYDLGLERTFYNDDINWSEFYFDLPMYEKMGISNFKLVSPWEYQQRTFIMYEKNKAAMPVSIQAQ